VAKYVWRDVFLFQRRAARAGDAHMFRKKVFDGIGTELFSSDSRKEWIRSRSILFAQPSP